MRKGICDYSAVDIAWISAVSSAVIIMEFVSGECYPEPMEIDPPTHWVALLLTVIISIVTLLCIIITNIYILNYQSGSRVEGLGGFSGFLTSNKVYGNNLFYWFFPAKNKWRVAPLVVFLAGGPGLSFMHSMFNGIGPFSTFDDGLRLRDDSWNVNHNLLLIDQPVGTGFSYSDKGRYPDSSAEAAEELYAAIVQYLNRFPQLKTNRLFIAGESYAGHYIPAIARTIHEKNASEKLKINLTGMMIGNGWMDPQTQIRYSDVLDTHRLIDPAQHSLLRNYELWFLRQTQLKDWVGAYRSLKSICQLVNNYAGDSLKTVTRPTGERESESSDWRQLVATTEFRRAIHVGDKIFTEFSGDVHDHLNQDMVQSVKPLVEDLLEQGYRIVFYNGELDIKCAPLLVDNLLSSLEYTGKELYEEAGWSSWCENGRLAGYVKGGGNLLNVTVTEAGHGAAVDQPFSVLQLLTKLTGVNDN